MDIYVTVLQSTDCHGKVGIAQSKVGIQTMVGEGYALKPLRELKVKMEELINNYLAKSIEEGE